VPVLLLFYLLVRRRWLASKAGAAGALAAVLIAWLLFEMPLRMAAMSFVHGAAFGLLPIGWTIFTAMLIYNITVETGQFNNHPPVGGRHLRRRPHSGNSDRVLVRGVPGGGGRRRHAGGHLRRHAHRPGLPAVHRGCHLPDREPRRRSPTAAWARRS